MSRGKTISAEMTAPLITEPSTGQPPPTLTPKKNALLQRIKNMLNGPVFLFLGISIYAAANGLFELRINSAPKGSEPMDEQFHAPQTCCAPSAGVL